MKPLIVIALLFLSFTSFSQSIVGKWKPVFVSMDTFFRADVMADTMFVNSAALKEQMKDDEEPEQAEKMMNFMFSAIFRAMKGMEEEFLADGTHKEINTRTGNSKTSSYRYDAQNKTLFRKSNPEATEEQKFDVAWKNDQLVLNFELGTGADKKGKMQVVYKKM
jgi:hypothetical protein